MTKEEARTLLRERGIPFEADRLVHYVEVGNCDVVELFLDAGADPGATAADGRPALVVAAEEGRHEIASVLLARGADEQALLDALHRRHRKRDVWDKLSTSSGVFTFVSSVLIAAVGGYFTSSYNDRQITLQEQQATRDEVSEQQGHRLTEMETVVKMIPYLAADETQKKAALLTLSVLARPELATRMAQLFGGEGSIGALQQIAESDRVASPAAVSALAGLAETSDRKDAASALESLGSIFRGKERSVVQVLSNGGAICSGFLSAERWVATAADRLGEDNRNYQVRAWDGSARDVARTVPAEPGAIPYGEMKGARAMVFLEIRGSTDLPPLPLATQRSHPGERLIALGYGETKFVVEVGRAEAGKNEAFDVVRFSSDRVGGGTGGGPILNDRGEVACMIFQGTPQADECVPAVAISTALANLPPP